MVFAPGRSIARRDVHLNGMIAAVQTTRVVRDDAEALLTWTAAGSDCMLRGTRDGVSIRKMSLAERDRTPSMLWPRHWEGRHVLIRTEPEADHSVWWFFDLEMRFEGWYVNLESPVRRWSAGIDILDHALDILVAPDRSWSLKDEDELAERIDHPAYWTAAEADRIRAAAERIIVDIEADRFPFDGRYTDFRPDPSWKPAALPPYWDSEVASHRSSAPIT